MYIHTRVLWNFMGSGYVCNTFMTFGCAWSPEVAIFHVKLSVGIRINLSMAFHIMYNIHIYIYIPVIYDYVPIAQKTIEKTMFAAYDQVYITSDSTLYFT